MSDNASSRGRAAPREEVALSVAKSDEGDLSSSARACFLAEERDVVHATELPISTVPPDERMLAAGLDAANAGQSRKGERSQPGSDGSSRAGELPVKVQEALQDAGLVGDSRVADPDDDDSIGDLRKLSWYKKRRLVLRAVLLVVSTLLLAAGVTLASKISPERLVSFRWLLFFGAMYPLFVLTKRASKYGYYLIELYHFQEPLYHFSSLKSSTHNLLFFGVLLLWYFMVFEWLWCGGVFQRVCSDSAYVEVTRTIMKILACALLASLASFIASLVSKLISTHFLKSTHFKKLRVALEKEYVLKTLSNPRLRRKPEPRTIMNGTPLKPTWGSAMSLGTMGHSRHKRSKSNENFANTSGSEDGSHHSGDKFRKNTSFDDLATLSKLKALKYDGKTSQAATAEEAPASGSSSPKSASSQSTTDVSDLGNRQTVELEIGQNVIDAMKLEMLKDSEARQVTEMSQEEIDKLRTAVVIKTSSAMMRQHKFRTAEEQKEQLQKTRAFGKALYYTIRGKDSKRPFITLHDVQLFYPETPEGKKQADAAFALFAQDPQAKVNMRQVVEAVLAIYKDRGNIAASLSNTETMIDSLRGSLAAGLHFLFLALYMVIWNIDILAGFSAFSATVLALSFIFGNSIRNLFESMLFLFVEHPYDIGDWVTFDENHYEVVKITLLNTTFRDTGKQPTIMPNAALIPKQIKNLTRSDEHLELLFVEIDFGMAQVVKHEIKHRLVEFVKNNPNDYKLEPMWVTYVGVLPNMKANLLIIWCYACHPGDWDRKLPLRDRAIQLVTDIFARHGQNGAKYTYTHNIGGVPPAFPEGGQVDTRLPQELISQLRP